MNSETRYNIHFEDRGEYLYVLVSGDEMTAAISAAYWNEIAGKCFALEKNKILIEKNFSDSVSAPEMLQMSEHLGQLLPTRRIAFVDRYRHEAINELGKRLARNRSVMLQTFENTQDAERWLLAN